MVLRVGERFCSLEIGTAVWSVVLLFGERVLVWSVVLQFGACSGLEHGAAV